jgi:hypothetical protein
MQGMMSKPVLPESLAEAQEEILRLVELLNRERQKLAGLERSNELLSRVPVELARRVGPGLIVAMAEGEGEKAAREEAARQQRDLPRFLEELMRRVEGKHQQAGDEQGSTKP